MPSIVKLSSGDARAWRQNQPVWISEEGEVVRPVSREEQHAISRALARTSRITQSFRQTLSILPLNTNGRSTRGHVQKNTRKLEVAFEIGYVGQQRVVNVFAGNLRYMTGRQMLAARLLAEHGEAILHGAGGKCIAVLRDPLIHLREPSQGKRVQWSKNAEEKVLYQDSRQPRERSVTPVKRPNRRLPAQQQALPVRSPARCPNDCRGLQSGSAWYVAKDAPPLADNVHHPTCKFARGWAETLAPAEERYVLYDLETSRILRRAEPEELEEARAMESRTGSLQVTLQDEVYAVLLESEAEQAQAEARGDIDPNAAAASALDAEPGETNEHEADTLPPEAGPDAEADEVDLSSVAPPAPAASSGRERDHWPTLGQLTQSSEPYRDRAEVTARDYLARRPLSVGPTE